MLRIKRRLSQDAEQKKLPLSLEIPTSQSPVLKKNRLQPLAIPTGPVDLKRMERTYSPKSPRTKYEYKENYTASIALPIGDNVLDKNKNNIAKLSSLSHDLILEHAARRVDLFFYTLIAYYNSHIIPESGWTKLQHGRGRSSFDGSSITQACHSSFTPDLIDNIISKKIPIESDFDDNLTIKTSLVSGTHFMDSLNSTIELPKFVNEFDGELETVYFGRHKSLAIIADVANGKINPVEGLTAFLLMMQNTFHQMRLDKRFYKSIFSVPPYLYDDESISLKGQLLDLVTKGTLINKWDKATKSVSDEYISMLLRLTPEEAKTVSSDALLKAIIYGKKTLEVQQEIVKTMSSHVHLLPEKSAKMSR